jgi:hypothetical protein
LLGNPIVEHRGGNADVVATVRARKAAAAGRLVHPTGLHRQQLRGFVRAENGVVEFLVPTE